MTATVSDRPRAPDEGAGCRSASAGRGSGEGEGAADGPPEPGAGQAQASQEAAAAGTGEGRVLRTVDEALEHVHAICFKTGPPRLVGAELEWTVHHADAAHRPLDLTALRVALGDHAPRTLDPHSSQLPLPRGGAVSVEPGGQVEISTAPLDSLSQLHDSASADLAYLSDLLGAAGLRLGERGLDPYRNPRRLLHTPRYDAMAASFARRGPAGLTMMAATAATQVCLDAGEPGRVAGRWRALHALGPVLLALFANSRRHRGRDTGWASARMQAWLDIDPARTWPVSGGTDPAVAWGRYALAAPLLCLRRPVGEWHAPAGVTFLDWIAGAVRPPPTVADLEYHLGTLFPPVRPRGYLEVRFLDAQPPGEWFAPVAVLAALLADPAVTEAAATACAPVSGAWATAARRGLADRAVRRAAASVAELADQALTGTDLTTATREAVAETVSRRLAAGEEFR